MFQEVSLNKNSNVVSQQTSQTKKKRSAEASELNAVFGLYLQENKENFDPTFHNGKNSLSGKFESDARAHYEVEAPTVNLRKPFAQLSVKMLR